MQQLVDDGLRLYYGFCRSRARQAFLAAHAIDPNAAMPLIGAALAAGPNLNSDATAADIQEGCGLARRGSAVAVADHDKTLADALVARYCEGLTVDAATEYAIAMGERFQQYPDDPHAAVLYADSLQLLRPRTPEQNVELVAVLERVLTRWPLHLGANHYYIHAVEGSPTPERAVASARRLENAAPTIGHLLHMPSHIYVRIGDYDRAIEANERAVAADQVYQRVHGLDPEQAMYSAHNLESLAIAAGFAGRFAVAYRAAATPTDGMRPAASSEGLRAFSPLLAFVLLRFNRASAVIQTAAPPAAAVPDRLWYHFARAVAHAQLGHVDLASAERSQFQRFVQSTRPGARFRDNVALRVLDVFAAIADARIAQARGDQASALQAWRRAVEAQDRLEYHEPPPVYYSVRESLGALLYAAGRLADAEAVFREDLERHPRNPRSLFGLWHTLEARERREQAQAARRDFEAAWLGSDTTLSLDRF